MHIGAALYRIHAATVINYTAFNVLTSKELIVGFSFNKNNNDNNNDNKRHIKDIHSEP